MAIAPAPSQPDARAPAWVFAFALGIIIATAVAYSPSLSGGFVWDDDKHVPREDLRSTHGLSRIWFEIGATQQYYPLLYSWFWAQHRLWGDWTPGYHAVNIALHAGVSLLVLATTRRLLREKGFAWADPAACLSAAAFALHPVHVESVAWITEQKNTLSAVFYLSALLAYLRFDRGRTAGTYALATFLFVLSLLCKPVTVTLPPAILVILWWLRGRLSWKQDVLPLALWFALALTSGAFMAYFEAEILQAKGEAFGLAGLQRLLMPGRVVLFYLSKLLWPTDLIFVYPRWTVDPAVWWQWLFPLGGLAILAAALALVRRTRSPLAALLFFGGTLFPVLGFFNVYLFRYTYVADHFQYLASLGIIVLAGGWAILLASKLGGRAARVGALLVIPAVLGVLTYRQCRMYSDIVTLYETTIARNPRCGMAHNNLGIVLVERGNSAAAAEHFRRAVELNPDDPEPLTNMGAVLFAAGKNVEAIQSLEAALRLKPDYTEALDNLIGALIETGQLPDAIGWSMRAITLQPHRGRHHFTLAIALGQSGRPAEAVPEFEAAIRLDPNMLDARWQLAMTLVNLGRRDEGLKAGADAMERARSLGAQDLAVNIDRWMKSVRGTPPK